MTIKAILSICLFLGAFGCPVIVHASAEAKAPVLAQQSPAMESDGPAPALSEPETIVVAEESPATQPDNPATASPEAAAPPKIEVPKGIFTMNLKHPGVDSRFEMSFVDIPPGSEIVNNEPYPGWCAQRSKYIRKNATHEVRLYAIDDPDLPPAAQGINWHEINYTLNHKEGNPSDVQNAVWYLTDGKKDHSKETESMVKNAEEHGRDYVPGSGEITAVICDPGPYMQLTFIEYRVPVVLSQAAPPVVPESAVPPVVPPAKPFIPPIPIPIPIPLGGGGHDNHNPPVPVPEPDAMTLSVIGLAILGTVVLYKRRRHGKTQQS
jgi:hypothetical protein